MAKTVSFGMSWMVYGRQEIELPDDVDPIDEDAVKEYIRSVWPEVPLPSGEYVDGSDEFDEECELRIHDDKEEE